MLSALPQWLDKLVEPARWLLVMGIAYTLATTALYFLAAPQSATPVNAPTATSATTRKAPDIEAIVSRNLFGVADSAAVAQPTTVQAVETRLPLELHGVFVADEPEASAAIVAQKGKPGVLYTVGDDMPGNASLVEVHTDHIVLRRGGARERLTFPQAKDAQFVAGERPSTAAAPSAQTPANRQAAAGQSTTAAANPREFVAEYRDKLNENPNEVLSELGIAPVSAGDSAGYRLGNLASSPYLSQTGLQPGDVILSINGRPVGDISLDRMEIDNVLAQGSARLEVQRGTRRFFVTASL